MVCAKIHNFEPKKLLLNLLRGILKNGRTQSDYDVAVGEQSPKMITQSGGVYTGQMGRIIIDEATK